MNILKSEIYRNWIVKIDVLDPEGIERQVLGAYLDDIQSELFKYEDFYRRFVSEADDLGNMILPLQVKALLSVDKVTYLVRGGTLIKLPPQENRQ